MFSINYIRDSNPQDWDYSRKLSFEEICESFNLHTTNNYCVKLFLDMEMGYDFRINEEILKLVDFDDEPLMKHYIHMAKNSDYLPTKKKYESIICKIKTNLYETWNLKALLHQMTNPKAVYFRQIFMCMQMLQNKYKEYEQIYNERQILLLQDKMRELHQMMYLQARQMNSIVNCIDSINHGIITIANATNIIFAKNNM